MEILIVNLTADAFFRYSVKDETDKRYNKKLLELLTPPDKKEKYSHWMREDKIVICPRHLHDYVEKKYCEIYV